MATEITLEEVLKIGRNITQWEGSKIERPIILGWPGVYGRGYDNFKRNDYNLIGKMGRSLLHLTFGDPYLKECGRNYAPLRSVEIKGSANLLLINDNLVIFNKTFTSPERYLITSEGIRELSIAKINDDFLSSPYGQIHSFVKDIFENKITEKEEEK